MGFDASGSSVEAESRAEPQWVPTYHYHPPSLAVLLGALWAGRQGKHLSRHHYTYWRPHTTYRFLQNSLKYWRLVGTASTLVTIISGSMPALLASATVGVTIRHAYHPAV